MCKIFGCIYYVDAFVSVGLWSRTTLLKACILLELNIFISWNKENVKGIWPRSVVLAVHQTCQMIILYNLFCASALLLKIFDARQTWWASVSLTFLHNLFAVCVRHIAWHSCDSSNMLPKLLAAPVTLCASKLLPKIPDVRQTSCTYISPNLLHNLFAVYVKHITWHSCNSSNMLPILLTAQLTLYPSKLLLKIIGQTWCAYISSNLLHNLFAVCVKHTAWYPCDSSDMLPTLLATQSCVPNLLLKILKVLQTCCIVYYLLFF